MMQPPRAPIAALTMNERVTMFPASMPQRRAASRLAAQARICLPSIVRLKKAPRAATTRAPMPTTQRIWDEIYTPPRLMEDTDEPVK